MEADDALKYCQETKEKGNNALKANDFTKAIELYSESISKAKNSRVPIQKLSVYYANRSFANIKLENYGLALIDAQQSIKNNTNYEKAYLRLAFCCEITQKYKAAYDAYKKAFELSGNRDTSIYQKLVECKNLNQQFLKNRKLELLHDVNDRGPKKQQLYKNWKQIQVQSEYSGPTLKEEEQITSQWVIKLMDHYKDQKSLHKRFTLQLIEKCKNILAKYPALIDYQIDNEQQITICGDIHGQYYDLMNIFKLNGYPAINNKYLFNGDFVDRGSFSVECMMTLIAWKCVNKEFLHMTRGNHQAKQVNMIYGFKGQVEAKFKDLGVYQAFSQLFCALPLSYVFNKKIMVCHGGLPSQDNINLQNIRQINRFSEPPERGVMCDLLWADPTVQNGRSPSKRGVSMGFGPDICHRFLNQNKLDYLIRSHEVKTEGYEQAHNSRCITIFSAPNYCDFSGNKGAFIRIKGNQMKPKFIKFDAVPHPNIGPMAYANQFRGMF